MHASAPERRERSESGYARKSLWMRILIFGEEGVVGGKARWEWTTIDVMEGCSMH